MKGKRISVISILICILLLAIIVFLLKFLVFDSNDEVIGDAVKNVDIEDVEETKNESSVSLNVLTDILGEEFVKVEDGVKINISELLQEKKELDNFIFDNFYVYSIDGATRIEFDVTNDSKYRETLEKFKLVIYTDDQKVGEISCAGDEFAASQTKRLNVTLNVDVANLYNIGIEKIYTQSM